MAQLHGIFSEGECNIPFVLCGKNGEMLIVTYLLNVQVFTTCLDHKMWVIIFYEGAKKTLLIFPNSFQIPKIFLDLNPLN